MWGQLVSRHSFTLGPTLPEPRQEGVSLMARFHPGTRVESTHVLMAKGALRQSSVGLWSWHRPRTSTQHIHHFTGSTLGPAYCWWAGSSAAHRLHRGPSQRLSPQHGSSYLRNKALPRATIHQTLTTRQATCWEFSTHYNIYNIITHKTSVLAMIIPLYRLEKQVQRC